MDLWLIFLAGLTTGGLTCLAVQGGLLATAITRPVPVGGTPAEVPTSKKQQKRLKRQQEAMRRTGVQVAKNPWPVVWFLAAKLVAYTVLGGLLGALGAVVTFTSTVQAIMLIAVGLFMLATAANMLNIHPVFRYVSLQPPKAFTRLVRQQAKSGDAFAPLVLGFLTVLIPCSTTLSMETRAITAGDWLQGALIMFIFVLGTVPTFFVLGFLATQLRGKLQVAFAFAAALLLVILGFLSIDNGLTIADSPLAPSRIMVALLPIPDDAGRAEVQDGVQYLTIEAHGYGYEPTVLVAESGIPIQLRVETNNTLGCARAFMIPSINPRPWILDETGTLVVDIPAQAPGRVGFNCAMGMYSGVIIIQ